MPPGRSSSERSAEAVIDAQLVIGVSSRALFDLDACHQIFETQGEEAYRRHQVENEDKPLEPGVGFELVRKLLKINDLVEAPLLEVVLISRNSADTGLRAFNSIAHHGLDVRRAAFTGGGTAYRYARPFRVHLFLSASAEDVQGALQYGIPAAVLLPAAPTGRQPGPAGDGAATDRVHIAFDGDAVLFDPESERIFQQSGIEAFLNNEQQRATDPLEQGPFLSFAAALQELQAKFEPEDCPVRTALVTARSVPAHERAIRTLRKWGVRLDEALFLGGADKGEFLAAFGADIFFDDKTENCLDASRHTAAGHVPQSGPTSATRKPKQ